MSFYAARQIVPGLWVGSAANGDGRRATAAAWQRKNGIRLVINCTRDLAFADAGAAQYRIPVDDHPDEARTMVEHWKVVAPLIREHLFYKKPVLVHCYAGIQRSAATAAAYVMYDVAEHNRRTGRPPPPMRVIDALRFVKRRKPEAFDSKPTFGAALEAWARHLKT